MNLNTTPFPWAQAKLAEMEAHIAQLQKEHPEWDTRAATKWWVPSVMLGDILNTLDEETRDRMNACMARLLERRFAPDVVGETREKVKTLLVGYPEVQKRVDEGLFGDEVGLARAHEAFAKMEGGGNVLEGYFKK